MADQRAKLSRELITGAALEVVARDGLTALSMRRLAQELDVWPMSIYRHFRDKEELLDAVAAAGADHVSVPRGTGRKQLLALASEARGLLERQPSDLRRRALSSPGLLRLNEAAIAALTTGGLAPDDARATWRAVLAYVIGSIELDAAGEGSEDAFGEGLERLLRATIRA